MEALALVLLTAAVALAVLEAAIPGLGLAGIASCLLVAGVVWVSAEAETPWWPLLVVAVASAGWTLLVGMARAPTWAQAATAAVHGVGGVTYGMIADDPATIVVAVVGTIALAAAFPRLHGWTRRLVERQPSTGMESLVGRTAVVETGAEGRSVVRLDGSLWSISTPVAVGPGTPVVVRGWRGIVLAVEPVGPAPAVPSPPS